MPFPSTSKATIVVALAFALPLVVLFLDLVGILRVRLQGVFMGGLIAVFLPFLIFIIPVIHVAIVELFSIPVPTAFIVIAIVLGVVVVPIVLGGVIPGVIVDRLVIVVLVRIEDVAAMFFGSRWRQPQS